MKALWYRFLDWAKTASGNHIRYGVSYRWGSHEERGFVTESQAMAWIDARRLDNPLVFAYDKRREVLPVVQRLTSRQ